MYMLWMEGLTCIIMYMYMLMDGGSNMMYMYMLWMEGLTCIIMYMYMLWMEGLT